MYISQNIDKNNVKYKRIQDIAIKNGGVLLSDKYLGYRVKHVFQCSEGHQWETAPEIIYRKGKAAWCKICSDKRTAESNKLGLKAMQDIAIERGGLCLSTFYENIFKKYLWKCSNNHIWKTNFNNIKNGKTWCKECNLSKNIHRSGKKFTKKQTIKSYLESVDIKALQVTPFFILKCKNCNHQWQRRTMPWGNKCPSCSKMLANKNKKEKGAKMLAEYILSREGILLEDDYLGYRFPHRLQCKNNHQWAAKPHDLLLGKTWCRICSSQKKEIYSLESLNFFANKFEGTCTSKKYLGYDKNHKFICKNGHHFLSNLNRIISAGDWCSHCNRYNHVEERVRRAFEKIFGCTFIRTNPKWLKEPGKRHAYQLDGYNENKKIAFEYNGKQHYEVLPHFKHDTEENLKARQKNDLYKNMICIQKGITLLTISYIDASTVRQIAINCLEIAKKSNLPMKTTSLDAVLEAILFYESPSPCSIKQRRPCPVKSQDKKQTETQSPNMSLKRSPDELKAYRDERDQAINKVLIVTDAHGPFLS